MGVLGIYLVAYMSSTEAFNGRMGSSAYRIRLFRSVCHQQVFAPLLAIEEQIYEDDYEFSSQIRDGASLPPYEADTR
jgi:hypothetical protein